MKRLSSATIAVSALLLTSAASLAQETANLCENPTFRVPEGSPFTLSPKENTPGEPKALVAGNFIKRQDSSGNCGCDLAVALATPDGLGFVALLRGNDDGTFAQSAVFPLPVGEVPVAIVKARFKTAGSAMLDSFAVATQQPAALSEPGRVWAFTPDDTGAFSSSSTFWNADEVPVAMTAGDFNGDERFDIAVISRARSKLSVLLGAGDGSFSPPTHVDLNLNIPNSLAAGRFSGTGLGDDIAIGTISPDPADPAARRAAVVIVHPDPSGGFAVDAPMLIGEKNSHLPWVAAADLTAPAGATTRPVRDLAVAYVDADASGNPIARVKVMLGRDDGGFAPAQTQDLGPAFTRSATVADLDDDGIVDLVVSTYANEASTNDGTIRFFQGKTGEQAGFHANPTWFSIPEMVGIRPQSVAIGRFGPKFPGPAGSQRANMGLAVANAPGLQTVAIFLGNGRGAFVQPTIVTTPLAKTAHLFLTGDFHSAGGTDTLHDIAYLSDGEGGDKVLSILFSNGAGGFSEASGGPVASVGKGPHIAVSGNFDRSPPTDIAIVDTSPDPVTGAPFLTILAGRGDGQFQLFSQTSLESSKSPIALTAGHFSGQTDDAPADIAIISGEGGNEGKLTLLVNDSGGRFPASERRFSRIPFKPISIAVSDNLRGNGTSDLVVKDADASIVLLLQNLGHVDPGESQFKGGGFFGPTGAEPNLLIGAIPGNASAAQLDHIVTFGGSEIRAFRANATGTLDAVQVSRPTTGNFSTRPPYAIGDFGDGKPGLAVAAPKQEALGIVHLKGDGRGTYTFGVGHEEPNIPRGAAAEAQEETGFTPFSVTPGERFERTIIAALAAPFRSTLHGNSRPDVAFISSLARITVRSGQCPNDPEPQPPGTPATPAFTEQLCHREPPEFDACCEGPGGGACSHANCGPSLVCRPVEHPAVPAVPPPDPICVTTQAFAPIITVFANTCGD